ncbi:GNAT family N-acetyltransferase [Pedobacter immunditicola]|uniref:GNAT family N-acetyltransferase n=1 Tax=Pedobacter immunditicola TaxID=3133440 RepID=UPI0030B0D008
MLQINFKPFPELESARLKLRKVNETDVKEVFLLRSDAGVMKYIPRPLAKDLQDALNHIEVINRGLAANQSINWAITEKGKDRLIGMICLVNIQPENYRTEIGYILNPVFHGKGIADEALKTVIDYAFNTLKFHSLEALIDPLNTASENLLQRNNFVKEAHFKEKTYYNGEFLDDVIYSLIRPKG